MSDIRFAPRCDAAFHHLFTCKECLDCPESSRCFDEENWAKVLEEFPEEQDEDRDW